MDGKRIRVLKVSGELLRQVLKLPDNCQVIGLSHDLYFREDCWALRVESPDFSVVPFSHTCPPVYATYQSTPGGDGRPVVEFIGWEGEGIAKAADEPVVK